MRDLIGPDGQLHDFQPRPGDPVAAHNAHGGGVKRGERRWGQRVLLNNDPALFIGGKQIPARTSATLVDTGDLGRSYPINVQLRFAQMNNATGAIDLPFSPAWKDTFPIGLLITVRRATDPQSAITTDQYTIPALSNETQPFDTVTTRQLGVDVSIISPGGNIGQAWVEALATPVEEIADANKIPGYPIAGSAFFASVASPARVTLAPASPKRVQLIITNTSTNADLIVAFANNASWGPPPIGSFVLPKNVFATYQGPIGGYTGIVTGSWDNGAPDGGALVMTGSFF